MSTGLIRDPADARRGLPLVPGAPVLAIEGLSVATATADLVLDVSLSVEAGETLAIVGESGCGKSLTCLAAMGLLDPPLRLSAGKVRFLGTPLSHLGERKLRAIRGRDMAMIFQDATTALNPVLAVGQQVAEVLRVHDGLGARAAAAAAAVALLDRVGIPEPERRAADFPHQLSGGLCQRVMIAMALACRPRLLIADEATTALDVTTQAQILRLLRSLQAEAGMAMIFVTHDLGVVAEIADRVAVMYSGRVVELATADDLFERPAHPYTRGLMACRLLAGTPRQARLEAIEGTVPRPAARPDGCAFRPRCGHAVAACLTQPMLLPLAPVRPQRSAQTVACHVPQGARG